MKFSELQDKQVVNVQDGTLIGRVEDLDVSLTNYQVQSFLVGRNTRLASFVVRVFISAGADHRLPGSGRQRR